MFPLNRVNQVLLREEDRSSSRTPCNAIAKRLLGLSL